MSILWKTTQKCKNWKQKALERTSLLSYQRKQISRLKEYKSKLIQNLKQYKDENKNIKKRLQFLEKENQELKKKYRKNHDT